MNMYNFTGTLTDELIQQIESNAPKQIENVKKLYDAFTPSDYTQGVKYYQNETDILKKQIFAYSDGVKVEDNEATNEKIPSGMHKVLVDQKVAYLSGEPMSFGSASDNNAQLELIEQLTGERWEDTLPELIKNASNKGLEWLHPFVNENGDFDYMIIGAEQLIPIYDPKQRYKLTAAIRFYQIADEHIKLELWTDVDVTYYEMIKGDIYLDVTYEVNPAPHFANAEEGKSWGMAPFIKFANNTEELSDLHFNKRAVDAYETLVSKTQDTMIDMQEVIMVLKGYEGESLAELNENIKRYHAVKVDADEGGGIDTISAEIPTAAYQLQSEMLRKNIITSGQGVDPSPDVIGSAPSGVALEHLYGLLDMKASMLERKFTLALRVFMQFIEVYCTEANIGEFDARDVTFTFNKMLLTNEAEIITMARDSVDLISKTTILENHPWVRNVQQEQERLDSEKETELNAYSERYGSLGGDEDEVS